MKRFSLNIQTVVAAVFTLLFISAAFTTLFGQEQKKVATKEHTKIITLKITEDENGEVISIDTTMVFNEDELQEGHKTLKYTFESSNIKTDSLDKEIMIWIDDTHNVHKLHLTDSVLFVFEEENEMNFDSLKNIMVTVDARGEDMHININEDGENYVYKYKIDSKIDGDSIHMIINQHLDSLNIKDIEKYIIKSNVSPDGKEEKTVTVFTNTEAGDADVEEIITREITVEVDGDNVNVWTTDEGESYTVVTKTITLTGAFFLQIIQGFYDVIKKIIIQ
jgi:ribosomal protein S6E (S10)